MANARTVHAERPARVADRPWWSDARGTEREKTLTLRALKDLEFDRAMGKISEGDFAKWVPVYERVRLD